MKRSEISSRSMWFADSDREGEDDYEREDAMTLRERDMERTLLAWWWWAYFDGAVFHAQPRRLWLREYDAHRLKNAVEAEARSARLRPG